MNYNQRSSLILIEKIESQVKPVYKKPKTSLFLDPKNITGGVESIPESNSGILS